MALTAVQGNNSPARGVQNGKKDTASLEQRIQQLKEQLQRVKEDKKLKPDEKRQRIRRLEKQIARLQKQKEAAASEKAEDTQKTAEQAVQKNPERKDEFHPKPAEGSAGIYQPYRDEQGNRAVLFSPADEKSPVEGQNQPQQPVIMKTVASTDRVDREIQKLKQQCTELSQRAASEKNPERAEELKNQLAQIEAELARKDNDTYRRQHIDIIEQKVVSRIGE